MTGNLTRGHGRKRKAPIRTQSFSQPFYYSASLRKTVIRTPISQEHLLYRCSKEKPSIGASEVTKGSKGIPAALFNQCLCVRAVNFLIDK